MTFTEAMLYDEMVNRAKENTEMLEQMALQHQFIMECYEEGFVLEADANGAVEKNGKQVTVSKDKVKVSVFTRIKNFIKKILGLLNERTETILKRDKEIFNRAKELQDKDFTGITIKVRPYNDLQYVKNRYKKLVSDLTMAVKYCDFNEEALDKWEKDKSIGSFSLRSALQMSYEYPELQTDKLPDIVTYKNDAAKKKAQEIFKFCEGFQVNCFNFFKNESNKIETTFKDLVNNVSKNQSIATDSAFLSLLDCTVRDLGLPVKEDFIKLLEAGETNMNAPANNTQAPQKEEPKKEENNPKEEKPKEEKGGVEKSEGSVETMNVKEATRRTNFLNRLAVDFQLIVTTALDASVVMYSHYMTEIIRPLLGATVEKEEAPDNTGKANTTTKKNGKKTNKPAVA